MTRRRAPVKGLRPTVRFGVVALLTAGWVAFGVWASGPWRDQLTEAIGPVLGWVIPTLMAYLPGLVIGFMTFTLLLTRYREIPLIPPAGPWPDGEWPPVTIVIAAWNEEQAVGSTLESKGLVEYEPVALAFTTVPEKLGQLLTQRSRWARGMFEGLRAHPPLREPRVLAKLVASIDYLVPFLDIGIVFLWVPGVILAAFGYPLLVGWWSILLLPITLAIFGLLRRWQERHVFRRLGIDPGRNVRGFIGYLFLYQPLTSVASLRGYCQNLGRAARRWK